MRSDLMKKGVEEDAALSALPVLVNTIDGFQGQERDDEIKGNGNSYNYKYRMHDPRLGRFFAVDPLAAKYPYYTPYQFSGNKVIAFVELEGMEEKAINDHSSNSGYPLLGWLFNMMDWGNIVNPAVPITEEDIQANPMSYGPQEVLYSAHASQADEINTVSKIVIEAEAESLLIDFAGEVLVEAFLGARAARVARTANYVDDAASTVTKVENAASTSAKAEELVTNTVSAGKAVESGAMKTSSMTNAEVRAWYSNKVKALNTNVAYTKENAMNLVAQRNALKTQARSMMSDRQEAALLDKAHPINSFDYYVQKYSSQGYSGEALWKKIITGSSTPNAKVNTKFGL